MHSLADIHGRQRRFRDAENPLRRSLAIWQESLRPDHPYILTATSDLARLYLLERKRSKAEPLLERLQELRQTASFR